MDILVAVDLNDQPSTVVAHATRWARLLGGRLHLRSIPAMSWDPDDGVGLVQNQDPDEAWARALPEAQARLAGLAAAIPDALVGQHEVIPGPRVPALIEAASTFDLTVVGSHRRRYLARLAEGSVAAHVVRRVDKPVLVVPLAAPVDVPEPVRVVVAVVSFEESFSSVELVHRWLGDQAELHLVHVSEDIRVGTRDPEVQGSPGAWPEVERWQHHLAEANIQAHLHGVLALGAAPAPRLAELTDELDPAMLVVRTHGRTGLARLMHGSVAERLLRLVDRPVLVLT